MIKLNLGAGKTVIEGFTPIDRMLGSEVYPLECEDGSVDVIRASHVLEHFSHTQAFAVLKHWVDKLKPGGCLKIAVPDLRWIAKAIMENQPINAMGYLMGGQTDENDFHGTAFDRELLQEMMVMAGLERVGHWESEIEDCAKLPVSLNLMGIKPIRDIKTIPRGTVLSVLSAPRYGPISHMKCVTQAMETLGIGDYVGQGAYWHEVLCEATEERLEKFPEIEFIITRDFDSIYSPFDVLELYRLMQAYPEADAIFPLQSIRGDKRALFGLNDRFGNVRKAYVAEFVSKNITQVCNGHFGLTIFRASTLRKSKRPWMVGKPNDAGRWGDGRVDPDIDFWHRWEEQGFTAFIANRVPIAHSAEILMWPGPPPLYHPIYQEYKDYLANGIPPGVARDGSWTLPAPKPEEVTA